MSLKSLLGCILIVLIGCFAIIYMGYIKGVNHEKEQSRFYDKVERELAR